MILILAVILTFMAYFAYRNFQGELASPPVLYLVPFILMCVVCLFYQDEWNFHLQINTFLVIVGGALVFIFGVYVGRKIRIAGEGTNNNVEMRHEAETWKYIVLLVVAAVAYTWQLKLVVAYGRAHGNTSTVGEALNYYNRVLKFTTNELVHYPRPLSVILNISHAAAFVWTADFAHRVFSRSGSRINLILSGANLALAIVGSLALGARGRAVELICGMLACFLIFYGRRTGWKKKLPFRYLLLIIVVVAAVLLFFLGTISLLGRNEIHLYGRYLSTYIGSQLYNLNYFLNESFRRSSFWGEETFHNLIQNIGSLMHIGWMRRYLLDLPSVYAGEINMGNVYTSYYPYIHDFGYAGVAVLPFFVGFLSTIAYRLARSSASAHAVNMPLLFYEQVSYCLVFSYFSNKFYSLLISLSALRLNIEIFLVLFFMFYISAAGGKIRVYLGRRIKSSRRMTSKRKMKTGAAA